MTISDGGTKADPFTLEALIAWLEQQPGDEAYYWPSAHSCLACVYLEALGIDQPWVAVQEMFPAQGYAEIFGSLKRYAEIGSPLPWTFGAALARARAALTTDA